jgi:hypothetical protein
VPEFTACPDCGSTHLGGRCGLSFAQRLRSVQVHESVRATVHSGDSHTYYDRSALDDVFGADHRDRMLEETDGLGIARTDPRTGDTYHVDRHSGEWEKVTDDQVDRVYLGGDQAVG